MVFSSGELPRLQRNHMASHLMPLLLALLLAVPAVTQSQNTNDPFPTPIEATRNVITVGFIEFASVPDMDGVAARMMLLVDEPGTRRMFVNDMRGPIYSISYDGKTVTQYVDINATTWGVAVQSQGRERGFQSFAFHPQFNQRGARGYGKFYTFTDTSNIQPKADFVPGGGGRTHDSVLLEWTAKDPYAATYDGGRPRELMRFEQPFANHNGGLVAFNPLASPGSAEYGLLYVTSADGGSGGDPLNTAQNLKSAFGKILRIDPLGSNSANRKYGIPASNPFVGARDGSLGEIYAWGVRNAQRIAWDPKTGNMFIGDIGQGTVEEISLVTAGANLGWNKWEGSFSFVSRSEVGMTNQRRDPEVTYPIVEYGHQDPLFGRQVAVTMGYVYRAKAITQLTDKLLFGDMPSGEIFYINADSLPQGGQQFHRILFKNNSAAKTLLELIREKNARQGKTAATRADLRFGMGPDSQIFILNKADGTIRLLVPDR